MKKILLILLMFAGMQASAQLKDNMLNKPIKTLPESITHTDVKPADLKKTNKRTRAGAGWMSYQDAIDAGFSVAAILPLTPDSNMYIPNGNPDPFHWYLHMLGTSFDPTSEKFYNDPNNYYNTFQVRSSDAYSVDSIAIVGAYTRNIASQDDQLIIEITHSMATNTTVLQSASNEFFVTNLGLTDSLIRWATPTYDYANNKMSDSVTGKITITKTLDAAAYADTLSNGLNEWTFALPTSLSVPAGAEVIATVRFVPGTPFYLGQPIDSSNYWSHYCVEADGTDTYPSPITGEVASGLIATSSNRYLLLNNNNNPAWIQVNGTHYLEPTYWYGNAAGFDDPFFNFYVNCPTCPTQPLAVEDIAKLEGVSIYPNPANNVFNVSLNQALIGQDVTVSVTDLLGKKIIDNSFKASNLNNEFSLNGMAKGIYIYNVSSEGKSTSGKLVVQ